MVVRGNLRNAVLIVSAMLSITGGRRSVGRKVSH